jgi:Ca-activated chloride channel family protein
MLEGVLEALNTPDDPTRERYVMFLTDGYISQDTRVLAAIADQVGDVRLFAFGVGSAPNRYLLDEMAYFGGGKATWLNGHEAPAASVQRFLDTIDKPVLTDIQIIWGDWEIEDQTPERLPALYAGQPMLVSGRVIEEGTGPVVVIGRLGDRDWRVIVEPQHMDRGRTIPSTWARQRIGDLERSQIWGEVAELKREILSVSLEYQVLSQYTAFIAVEYGRTVNPGGPDRTKTQEVDLPAGSYQAAVGLAVGVTGDGGNPNIGGGSFSHVTYMLDGAAITDPVTGTFSAYFSFDAIERMDLDMNVWSAENAYAPSFERRMLRRGRRPHEDWATDRRRKVGPTQTVYMGAPIEAPGPPITTSM